jgi:hypothetical protein
LGALEARREGPRAATDDADSGDLGGVGVELADAHGVQSSLANVSDMEGMGDNVDVSGDGRVN